MTTIQYSDRCDKDELAELITVDNYCAETFQPGTNRRLATCCAAC